MPSTASRRLLALWKETVRWGLTAPGFDSFVVIDAGWVLTQGTHAVTEALVATGIATRRHHETFHRFFSRGSMEPRRIRLLAGAPVVVVILPLLACGSGGASIVGDAGGPDGVASSDSASSGRNTEGGGSQSDGEVSAADASSDGAGMGSEAGSPFWCPDQTTGNPMCGAHQWCIVPCKPFGGGSPMPPFCIDDRSQIPPGVECPGRNVSGPIVECTCV